MTTSFAAFVRTVRQTPLRELWRLPVVRQLWRYGLVGLSQNAIGYGLYLLVTWLGLPPKTAVSILYVVGVLISFFGNRRFTFAHGARGRSMTTVLVTGVGSVIGYGIIRSLRLRAVPCRIIGADIYPDAVGQAWTDVFEQAPYTRDPGYDAWLARVVAKHRVDVLMPGIEPDVFHANASREFLAGLGVRCVLNRSELIELSKDKWLQYQALGPVGEDVRIPTALACDSAAFIARHGLPCLLKERCGSASKGLIRLTRPEDLAALGPAETDETHIIQPIVGADDAEYTVGVFGDGCGKARASIAMWDRP